MSIKIQPHLGLEERQEAGGQRVERSGAGHDRRDVPHWPLIPPKLRHESGPHDRRLPRPDAPTTATSGPRRFASTSLAMAVSRPQKNEERRILIAEVEEAAVLIDTASGEPRYSEFGTRPIRLGQLPDRHQVTEESM